MLTFNQTKVAVEFLLQGSKDNAVPAVIGQTGIGKTAMMKKVAKDLGYELITFNTTQIKEGELALPVPDTKSEQTKVVYSLHHKIQEVIDNKDKKYLIFFDELNRPSDIAVINELMTVVNEKQIQGEHLPEQTKFVLSMNPTREMMAMYDPTNADSYDYAVIDIDEAHHNRFTFMYMYQDVNEWIQMAIEDGLNHNVINFLSLPEFKGFFYGKDEGDIQTATPRTWEALAMMLSDHQKNPIPEEILYELIRGTIGKSRGDAFVAWYRQNVKLINSKQVITNQPLNNTVLEEFKSYNPMNQITSLQNILRVFEDNQVEIEENGLENVAEGDLMTPQNLENYIKLQNALNSEDGKLVVSKAIANRYTHVFDKLYAYLDEKDPENGFVDFFGSTLNRI